MISAEELLKPVSDEEPCGDDLSYDPSFQELETLMRGKEETQFSAAEEPNWKALRERCLELWPRSKDLRLATALCLAMLKTDGLPGFRESLAVLKRLLERYWEKVYPLLDPADNNDPTQRVNIIAALATPVATFGDPMRVLERLREAPLSNSVQMGRLSLADILRSEKGETGPDQKPPPAAAQIEAALRDSKPEDLLAIHQAVSDSLTLAKEIDAFLTQKVGADKAPDLDLLPKELGEIQKRLTPYLPAGVVLAAEGQGGPTGAGEAVRQSISGDITSRQDVVRVLNKICEYYAREEPSSPVPCILRRAERLAQMDFMQIIDDLSPDAVKDIQRITGEKPKEGG
jgi:type VI secretion system protein ImpA